MSFESLNTFGLRPVPATDTSKYDITSNLGIKEPTLKLFSTQQYQRLERTTTPAVEAPESAPVAAESGSEAQPAAEAETKPAAPVVRETAVRYIIFTVKRLFIADAIAADNSQLAATVIPYSSIESISYTVKKNPNREGDNLHVQDMELHLRSGKTIKLGFSRSGMSLMMAIQQISDCIANG